MQIPTTLLLENSEIIKGLLNGELVRYGSVIRWAKGTEYGGQIFKHLVESPGITGEIISKGIGIAAAPLSAIPAIADLVVNTFGHAKTHNQLTGITQSLSQNTIDHAKTHNQLLGIESQLGGVTQSLSQVMGLTQIAAGASVLNLGISIAGFAYMGYKLHQVQKSLGYLQQTMDAGFTRVETRLDQISDQVNQGFMIVLKGLNHLDDRLTNISGELNYLYLLVQDSRQKQESIAKSISNLHKALLIKEISSLQAELNDLKRFPNESTRQALKTASRVRLFLGSQALQSTPELEAELMLNTDVAIQGWAVAIATEAHLLLEIGQYQEARQLLAEEVQKFQRVAHNWGQQLINNNSPALSTAYRFSAAPFKSYVQPERVARITGISGQDTQLTADQIRQKKNQADVEFEMSYAPQRYNQTWLYQQIALAEYLDTLSELTARLDTLQDFAALCENTGVKSSKELLPDADSKPGLHLLPICE